MSVIVRGIPQTKRALERVKLEIEAAAPAATKAGGEVVARVMQSNAPRNTGATAGSIAVSTDSLGGGAVAHAGPATAYARFRNFGTVFVSALHWIERSADASIPGVVSAMTELYRAAVK